MTKSRITHGEVEAAAISMIVDMFAPHELPVDEDLWNKYYEMARRALMAAAEVAGDGLPGTITEVCQNEKCPRGGLPVEVVVTRGEQETKERP